MPGLPPCIPTGMIRWSDFTFIKDMDEVLNEGFKFMWERGDNNCDGAAVGDWGVGGVEGLLMVMVGIGNELDELLYSRDWKARGGLGASLAIGVVVVVGVVGGWEMEENNNDSSLWFICTLAPVEVIKLFTIN